MTTKRAPATPLTTALLHECAKRGNRSAAFSRMLAHAERMETDRAKLVEALRSLHVGKQLDLLRELGEE